MVEKHLLLVCLLATTSCLTNTSHAESSPTAALSLRDAIVIGLQNNPDVAIVKTTPGLAEQDVLDANSSLDTTLIAGARTQRDVEPSGSTIVGSKYEQNIIESNLGIEKQFSTGTNLSLVWRTTRLKNSALFQALNPQYSTGLALTLSQPLLQGAWSGAPGVLIESRQKTLEATSFELAAELANQVKNIISAYWGQKFAEETLKANHRSLAVSDQFLSDAEEAVKLGMQASAVLTEAKVETARQRQVLATGENQLRIAAAQLRRVLGDSSNKSSPDPIRLLDSPVATSLDATNDVSLEVALKKRPEMKAFKLRQDAAVLDEKSAENGLYPEVNLVSTLGSFGLAGRATADSTNDFDSQPVSGGLGDSLSQLDNGDYYSAGIGIEVRYPLERSRARARYERSRIQHSQTISTLERARQTIVQEVTNAISEADTSSHGIELAKQSNDLALKNLQNAREQFKLGDLRVRDVTSAQRDLDESELALVKALVDFQIAAAEISRARGELLEQYGVSLPGVN